MTGPSVVGIHPHELPHQWIRRNSTLQSATEPLQLGPGKRMVGDSSQARSMMFGPDPHPCLQIVKQTG